jgi:hypothetical protein
MNEDSIRNSRYRVEADRGRTYRTNEIEYGPAGFITMVPVYCSSWPTNREPEGIKVILPMHCVQEIVDYLPLLAKAEPEPAMADVQAAAQS